TRSVSAQPARDGSGSERVDVDAVALDPPNDLSSPLSQDLGHRRDVSTMLAEEVVRLVPLPGRRPREVATRAARRTSPDRPGAGAPQVGGGAEEGEEGRPPGCR